MFSCTPSVFLNEDAETIRLMQIYHMGTPQQAPEEGGEYA